MNTLSLLIYGISTLLNFGVFLWFFFWLAVGLTAFSVIVMGVMADAAEKRYKAEKPDFSAPMRWLKRGVGLAVFAALLQAFIPNQKYLVLIAASEVGQMALEQQAVKDAVGQLGGLSKDAVDLLQLYIRQQTDELRKELSPDEKKGESSKA